MRFGKLWAFGGGGHVAPQSRLTIERGPFNFQSNEPFFVNTTTNGNIKNYTRCILGKYEVRGEYPSFDQVESQKGYLNV